MDIGPLLIHNLGSSATNSKPIRDQSTKCATNPQNFSEGTNTTKITIMNVIKL